MIETLKNKTQQWLVLIFLTGGTALGALFISHTSPLQTVEHALTDQLFNIRGPVPIEDTTVVVVEISQEADEEIPEKYPWPTRYYAKLIENLNKAGAKAIGIDVIFDNPDFHDPANDSLFAQALKEHDNVILAADLETSDRMRGEQSQSVSTTLVEPYPLLREANGNASGLVRMRKDEDDAIRRYSLYTDFNDTRYHSLALELLSLYYNRSEIDINSQEKVLEVGPHRIPMVDQQHMGINFIGQPSTFPGYSFETVIDDSTVMLNSEEEDFQLNFFSDPDFGLLEEEVFKDKIVLVGSTMPTLHDFHATPFAVDGTMPGVEIHANALQTILNENPIRHASYGINLLLLLLFTGLIVYTTKYFNAFWGSVFLIIWFFTAAFLVAFEFIRFNYLIDGIPLILTIGIGYISTLSYDYLKEQREKRRIREMFSSYVSPDLVDRMIESEQKPQLGGEEKYLTAFFSDIESFSSFSEQLPPQKLVTLINEYLSAMTDIITQHNGTLDKYIGDAIVAVFGAPVSLKDHAYRACLVSQLMQKELEKLRMRWQKEGDRWPPIVHNMQNRIGINTGRMVTGNMGSAHRFNYTMMGDNVNLAARCESGAKTYGVYTMVTEQTKKDALAHGDRCVFRYLDRIVVKGRTQPVNVYEIVGLKEDLTNQDYACIQHFEEGVDAYHQQDWKRALDLFSKSAELEKHQPQQNPSVPVNPSLLYLERCKEMLENPPADDWSGVFRMETK